MAPLRAHPHANAVYRSSILDTCLPYRDAYEAAQAEGFNAMRSICGLRTHEKRNSRVIPFRNLPAHVKREILADPEINYDIAPPDYERKKNGRKSNAKGPISWLAHFLIHRQKEFADWGEGISLSFASIEADLDGLQPNPRIQTCTTRGSTR